MHKYELTKKKKMFSFPSKNIILHPPMQMATCSPRQSRPTTAKKRRVRTRRVCDFDTLLNTTVVTRWDENDFTSIIRSFN